MRHKIEISMNPNHEDNSAEPYFWIIRSIDETNPKSDLCTVTAGCAQTTDKAWSEAANYYKDMTLI